jgi:protein O-mannosyl-transferase
LCENSHRPQTLTLVYSAVPGNPTMENPHELPARQTAVSGTAAEGRGPAKMQHGRRRNARRKTSSLAQFSQFSCPNGTSDAVTMGFLGAFLLSTLVIALNVYYPAIPGPFVFDDFTLPYQRVAAEPLSEWIISSGVRPLLMFTYWVNHELSGDRPAGYHILNLLIHVANTTLVFFVLSGILRMAGWAGRRKLIACCLGAAVFLVHPLQTESVSYIAGRSESLAAMFALLAYVKFLYRKSDGISWRDSVIVLLLTGIALSIKENAVAIIGVIALTDVFWRATVSRCGLRSNWKLYALMVPGAAAAGIIVGRVLFLSHSAGFALPVRWYQYGFTEARAIFTYLRLALLPFGQSIDHDFPVSRTIWEHGAFFYLLFLAALTGLLVWQRKRYPIACFGLLTTLILLAPTSSVIPISDPVAERRMYLPLVGVILIGCEAASRIRLPRVVGYAAAGAVLIVFSALCYKRNQLWSEPARLWEEAALQSTTNVRPYSNLVDELIQERRCDRAIPYLSRAEQMFPGDQTLQISWGRTLECLGRRSEALSRLRRAASIRATSYVYQLIGLLEAEMGNSAEAGAALQKSVELDPGSAGARNSLALWYESSGNLWAAEQEYRISMERNPYDQAARLGLIRVGERLLKQK